MKQYFTLEKFIIVNRGDLFQAMFYGTHYLVTIADGFNLIYYSRTGLENDFEVR